MKVSDLMNTLKDYSPDDELAVLYYDRETFVLSVGDDVSPSQWSKVLESFDKYSESASQAFLDDLLDARAELVFGGVA